VTAIKAHAPAKVNLTLHVTGQRDDGYHLLDSLVVFMGEGDQLTATVSEDLTIAVTGPFADGVPTDGTNLIMRAAAALQSARGVTAGAAMTLEKNLPHAAGIGSGSSDAAATLNMLARLWDVAPLPNPAQEVLALGADVPVCLRAPVPVQMSGIGEVLIPVPTLPDCALVLVRPPIDVPTASVFRGLATKQGAPMTPLPQGMDFTGFVAWLVNQRNDLQAPALDIAPDIDTVLQMLDAMPDVALARMSGSGATCFALVENVATADQVAREVRAAHPDYWVSRGAVLAAPNASTKG
jgi:4-diphosphocytidyl-2-C-methyl-D-erythritol kinase